MSDPDRQRCRKTAMECSELARATNDPELKELLRIRAQEWLKLAYANSDAEFVRLLDTFNGGQLGFREPPPVRRQPMQQQQKKADDKGSP
jgi:hypothetical protein